MSSLRMMMDKSIIQDRGLEQALSDKSNAQAEAVAMQSNFQYFEAHAAQREYGMEMRIDELERMRNLAESQAAHLVHYGNTELAELQQCINESHAESEAQQHTIYRIFQEELSTASRMASSQIVTDLPLLNTQLTIGRDWLTRGAAT